MMTLNSPRNAAVIDPEKHLSCWVLGTVPLDKLEQRCQLRPDLVVRVALLRAQPPVREQHNVGVPVVA
jgi:hypothetical protein